MPLSGSFGGSVRPFWHEHRSPSSLWVPESSCSTSYRCARAPDQRRAFSGRAACTDEAPAPSKVSMLDLNFEVDSPTEVQQRQEAELGSTILYYSDWKHRAWTWSTISVLSATFVIGLSRVHSPQSAAAALVALLAAYYTSDLATGVYHWGVDNYGDGSTPIVGEQIAAFHGHHKEPWTITEREFCNNVHKVFKPALPFASLCLLASPFLPGWADVGLAVATGLTCMSQQFHAWAHSKGSRLPGAVLALQEKGILVSRRAHGAHHRAPFEGNYCIVSGAWNSTLDDSEFFRRLEKRIFEQTGVKPRCWLPMDSSVPSAIDVR